MPFRYKIPCWKVAKLDYKNAGWMESKLLDKRESKRWACLLWMAVLLTQRAFSSEQRMHLFSQQSSLPIRSLKLLWKWSLATNAALSAFVLLGVRLIALPSRQLLAWFVALEICVIKHWELICFLNPLPKPIPVLMSACVSLMIATKLPLISIWELCNMEKCLAGRQE